MLCVEIVFFYSLVSFHETSRSLFRNIVFRVGYQRL